MSPQKPSTKVFVCLLLGLLGFLGNWFKLELFFNVDFLCGSVFVMLAILMVGNIHGVIAGSIAATSTYFLWNHPWAVIIFTGEALFVSWMTTRRKGNPVIYDLVYWLIIGMPLVYLFYHHVMAIEMQSTLLIMLKQSINGIFNTLIAFIVYNLQRHIRTEERIAHARLIFMILVTLAIVPAMAFLVIGVRTSLETQKAALDEKVSYALKIAQGGLANWVEEHHQTIRAIAAIAGDPNATDFFVLQRYVETIHAATPAFSRMGILNKNSVTVAYSPLETDGKSTLGVDFSDRPYISILKEKKQPYIPNVVMGKLGNPIPLALLLAPIVVDGEYRGYVSGVIDISQISGCLRSLVHGVNITLVDGNWKVIASNLSGLRLMVPFLRAYSTNREIQIDETLHWVPGPQPGSSIMERWRRDSLLIRATALNPYCDWKVIVEVPVLPLVEQMSRLSIHGLCLIWIFLTLTVALSLSVSKGMVSTIERLENITKAFPELLDSTAEPAWPESRIVELDSLSDNFRKMLNILKAYFREIQMFNETLESRVVERTKALHQRESYLSAIIENQPGLVWLKDTEGRFLAVNKAFAISCGEKTGEKVIGKTDLDIWPPELANRYRKDDLRVMATAESVIVEEPVSDGGETRWFETFKMPVSDEQGNIIGTTGYARDLTDRKRFEKEIIRAREEWELTFNAIQDFIAVLDARHRIVKVNKAMADKLGVTPQEAVGLTCCSCVHGTEKPPSFCPHTQLLADGQEHTADIYEERLGGDCLVSVSPLYENPGQLVGSVHIARDITARKREEKLQTAQLRLIECAATYSVMDFLQKSLDEAETLTCSQIGFYHFAGDDQKTLTLQTWSTNTLANMCTAVGAGRHYPISEAGVWVDCFLERKPVIHNDYDRLPHKKGQPEGHAPLIRELVVPVIRGEKIVAILGVGNKKTDYETHDVDCVQKLADHAWETVVRKRAEEALQKSEERFRALAEMLPEAVCETNRDLELTFANRRAFELFGYSVEDLKRGLNGLALLIPEDRDRAKENIARRLKGEDLGAVEYRALRKDGAIFPTLFHVRPIMNEGEAIGYRGIAIDITERKRAEEEREKLEAQNRQLQKAESLSRMAGAVAHHFNNQLMVVMGNLEFTMEDLPRGDLRMENLTAAMKAARRASEVSGLMLTYLGQTTSKQEPMDICDVCRLGLPLLRTTLPETIRLETDFPSPGPTINGNPNQVQQVLTNLTTNAGESIAGGGGSVQFTIKTVSARNIPESHRYPIDWQPQEGVYACLEVKDSGCGIEEKDIEKLFDPFFTTKFAGRGLGLPVVLGILKGHRGAIRVESEPGRGSTFQVFLPVSAQSVAHPPEKTTTAPEIKGGGTVLLVEDEEQVRKMARMMLMRLGFSVLEARDGVEAVEVFRQHRDEIRCVLSDLTMPRMDGWETLSALRNLSPGIPVILASGYDEGQVMAGDHPERPDAFLHKPFSMKDLAAKMQQILAEK